MKKLSVFAMAILLVPWISCRDQQADDKQELNKMAGSSEAIPAVQAKMILPAAKDTTLPSGRRNLYLVRGRDQKGLFIERDDFPAGYIGMPHVHNDDLYVTILKGSVYIGFGEKLDTTVNSQLYGVGSFIRIPADQAHYEWFKEPCTMQIEGIGPQSTYYISQEKK